MQDTSLASMLREELVHEIGSYIKNPMILEAFRTIPRHLFVPSFFNFDVTSNQWTPRSMADGDWLQEVYKNRPLTVSLNQQGHPNSSSSQPNLMAQMIESAQLQPGSRVLEIGTGTGYNAAILASIVGNKYVTSVDINDSLLEQARDRINQAVGPGVTILHADGRSIEHLGLFDAIIVTGSNERVEPSWIHALRPGGQLVFNWMKKWGLARYTMIEAEKIHSGLVGHAAPYLGDFMALYDSNEGANIPAYKDPLPVILPLISSEEYRFICEDAHFGFFLQMKNPLLQYRAYRNAKAETAYAIHDTNRMIRLQPGAIRGDVSLWKEIHMLYQEYEQLGKPEPQAFILTVDYDGVIYIAHM